MTCYIHRHTFSSNIGAKIIYLRNFSCHSDLELCLEGSKSLFSALGGSEPRKNVNQKWKKWIMKNKKLKTMLTNEYSCKNYARHFVLSWTRSKPTFFNIIFSIFNTLLTLSFPGQEVNQHSSTSSSTSSSCFLLCPVLDKN